MKNFESFEKEYDVIMKEYLSNLDVLYDRKKLRGRPCLKTLVSYNDKEYYLYDYSSKKLGICDLLLVPRFFSFKEETCDDVVKFGYTSCGIGVQKYHFTDDTIERESYDYISYTTDDKFNDGMVCHNSSYTLDRDKLSELFKSCPTKELFFTGLTFGDYCRDSLIGSNSIHLMRSDDFTKYIVVDNSKVGEAFDAVLEFMQGVNYKIVEDPKPTLFEMTKKIRENNKKIG